MSFADHYFSRYPHEPLFIEAPVNERVGVIVIIPCYDDPWVFETLASLDASPPGEVAMEVIVVVNSGQESPAASVASNRKIYEQLLTASAERRYHHFMLHPILLEQTPKKIAGVGYARKTAMDEAVRRFASLDRPDGIIASLDADSRVGRNYRQVLEQAFLRGCGALTLQFQHDFDASRHTEAEIEACRLYEIYLRYYRIALSATGFPHAFHTIGSSFAVNAISYIKSGGMSRRQAGEDFYFLHKVAKMTPMERVDEPLVYPSARESFRVPFGTGATVRQIVEGTPFEVYPFEAFLLLKRFFACFEALYADPSAVDQLPEAVIHYCTRERVAAVVEECRAHSSHYETFKKRLFNYFDAFFVVKFLNSFDSSSDYPPCAIEEAADQLLTFLDVAYDRTSLFETMLTLDQTY